MNAVAIGSTVTRSERRTALRVHVPSVVRFVVSKVQVDANVNRVSLVQPAMFVWKIITVTMHAAMKDVNHVPAVWAVLVPRAISTRVNANASPALVEGKREEPPHGGRISS